jgi:integrase
MVNKIKKLLFKHEIKHDLAIKKKYSVPKTYIANGDLSKQWYVYFSYRNPITEKMERMPNINVSNTLDKKQRIELLKSMQSNLSDMLKNGFNPYDVDNNIEEEKIYNIREAFDFALNIKEQSLKGVSFSNFKNRILKFDLWLNSNGFEKRNITSVTKKTVITYLNEVLERTSPRNRNNTRTDIQGIFQVLEDNEIITTNFITNINILKAKPERNKSYSTKEEDAIFEYMKNSDPLMLLFVKFISYNFLRPVEACRLLVGDIDLIDKKIRLKTKTTNYKIKILPQILIDDLPDLTKYDKNAFLFGRNGIGEFWEAEENNRRNTYSEKFKAIKDKFNLGKDYGLYSFRHTFIGKLYHEFIKTLTPFEAKSKLMLITGHATMKALEEYLRDIDAVLPDDYSEYLEKKK